VQRYGLMRAMCWG